VTVGRISSKPLLTFGFSFYMYPQSAFIPYITDMTNVGKLAQMPVDANTFIPQAYNPTETDVRFVGAMGILAIITYGFAFVGGISFMVFCLHAYNIGKPEERSGSYFQGRLGFYGGILAVAGLVQMMLGAYCRVAFGFGVLEDGPVQAAMLTVTFPILSVFVGLFQVLMGVWAVFRSVGYHKGPNDFGFQIFLAFQWMLVLTIQCITQIGYLPEGALAAAAPSFAAMSLSLTLMPAFLDHKMRTLPRQFSVDYYTLPKCDSSTSSEGTMPKDGAPGRYAVIHQAIQDEIDI
jgi:hypothetical protein